MLDFHSPKFSTEVFGEGLAVFTVEPLERGFGYTFGNSLRRVLLSSLEGAAVSSVQVDGVAHEFSSVAGVKEDVADIILNLKKLVFVLHGEDEEIDVQLVKDGPGEAKAADIDVPSNLIIVNPDATVATLEDGAHLEMMLKIRRGVGYVSADENKPAETVIGWIPVDSILSPVTRVAYRVEASRVGQRTDYDKLILEVETNGAATPQECVAQSAKLLTDMLRIFVIDAESDDAEVYEDHGGEEEQPDATDDGQSLTQYDDTLIEELELSVRSYNCLKREGLETVGELISRTETELLNIPNFGKKSIDEVRDRLARLGLKLRGE
ncbi:MAG: DNA-directed RNA polymerase subunit alpha [Actinobacteria bacterium]|nr:DNA-directed RNA polymerase subunit alpha [Actinomycetota bacterium]